MSGSFHVGRRVSYSGKRCTVKYVGEVQGHEGDWIGVEWDDPTEGKNDGSLNGVRYFSCHSATPTSGSFLRPHRRCDEDIGFLEALRNKYAPANIDKLNDHKAIRISGKTVEEIGFERINQQLARLPELQSVVLDGFCIYGVVSCQRKFTNDHWALELRRIQDLDLRIQELDLSRNLFEDFADVIAIARSLKSLRVLKLNGNRFQVVLVDKGKGLGLNEAIKELYLDETYLTSREVASIVNSTRLTTLSLVSNDLSLPLKDMSLPSLTELNLASNKYTSLGQLANLSELFPSLKRLSLRANPLKNLECTDCFSKVTTLDLSSTRINDEALVLIPRTFPSLESLLTTGTPLKEKLAASREMTIARLKTIKSLNHTNVSPQERTNAELFYLSCIARLLSSEPEDKETEHLKHHPRYQELCEIHGAPDIKRTNPSKLDPHKPEPGTLASRLTKFTFYTRFPVPGIASSSTDTTAAASSSGGTTIERPLPRTIGIYPLKGVVGRMFNLQPMSLRLVWETGEWDPREGFGGDGEGNSRAESTKSARVKENKAQRDPSKWVRRETELMDGTRSVGFWIEGDEAVVRVELR